MNSHLGKRPNILRSYILAMIVIAVVPLLFGGMFYVRSSKVIAEQENRLANAVLQMVGQRISDTVNEITGMCVSLKYRYRKLEMPPMSELTTRQRLLLHDEAQYLKKTLLAGPGTIEAVYMINPQSGYALTISGITEEKLLFTKYYESYGVSSGKMSEMHRCLSSGRVTTLSDNRLVYTMTVTSDKENAVTRQLVAVLKTGRLLALIEPYTDQDRQIECLDMEGNVLLSCGEAILQNKVEYRTSFSGFSLVMNVSSQSKLFYSRVIRIQYLVTVLAAILLCVLIIRWILRQTVQPVQQVLDTIKSNCLSDSDEAIHNLTEISEAVNSMVNERYERQQELQRMRDEAIRHNLQSILYGLENREFPNMRYVIADFGAENGDFEKAARVLERDCPEGYKTVCVLKDHRLCMLLLKPEGELTEAESETVLRTLLQRLVDEKLYGLQCGMSLVHSDYNEMKDAIREANIACDTCEYQPDLEVMPYHTVREHPEYFLRDFRHLDKQLRFSVEVWNHSIEEAKQLLKSLFPQEFLEEQTDTMMSQLHLSSLKYQFLHDITTILNAENEAYTEQARNYIDGVLSAKNHGELLNHMTHVLELTWSDDKHIDEECDEQSEQVHRYVHEHFKDQQLSVSTMAESMNMLPNTLSKQFSRKNGMGISQYIQTVRIEEAKKLLLEHPSMPVSEIAGVVGYATVLTFNRAFKNTCGVTPTEYRQRNSTSKTFI